MKEDNQRRIHRAAGQIKRRVSIALFCMFGDWKYHDPGPSELQKLAATLFAEILAFTTHALRANVNAITFGAK